MASPRKRSTAKQKQTPDNPPLYSYPYYYPPYGYVSPSYYDPTYAHPEHAHDQSDYVYYPVDESGHIMGSPTRVPPFAIPHYFEPYSHPVYVPPYAHRPTPPSPSRRGFLPPIQRPQIVAHRYFSPNPEGFPQYLVHDITERNPRSPVLSSRDALRTVQHYDRLRKSYY